MVKPSTRMRVSLILVACFLLVFLPTRMEQTWRFKSDELTAVSHIDLSVQAAAIQPLLRADFRADGMLECLNLKNKVAEITDCHSNVLWQSPATWQVREAQVTDMNGDGKPEAMLVVWRPFQPWPIDRENPAGSRIKDFHDRSGQSCHVILIHWAKGSFRELWAGSSLIRPVSQLRAADLDGDGQQELVALEGYYDSPFAGRALTIWRWRGFGFVLLDKQEMSFRSVEVINNGSTSWIVTK